MRVRLRYGTRTLLLAIAAAGVLLGLAGRWWLEDREQRGRVARAEELLAAEGRVRIVHLGRRVVAVEFAGRISTAAAEALSAAYYIKWVELRDPAAEEAAQALRKGFEPFSRGGEPPVIWGRADYDRFVRFVADRGGKLPSRQ